MTLPPIDLNYPFMRRADIEATQPLHGPEAPTSGRARRAGANRARRLEEDRARHPGDDR